MRRHLPVTSPSLWLVVLVLVPMAVLVVGPALSVGARDAERVTIKLYALNDSGVTGEATLTARGNKTNVDLTVTGLSGDHPNHVHVGNCDRPEPNPQYPLSDLVLNPSDPTGRSETTVDVPLDDLLSSEHVILIHKSKEEIGVYVACADIVQRGSTSAGGTNNPTDMPNTGVGSSATNGTVQNSLLAGLAALAAAFAATGCIARFRRDVPGR
ncbi:MAG: hypothetical protein QOF01_141 [Thermomicrobiales bacterium]|nr:hypothetical protein [Thermomicrobiales bacterium]